MGDWSLTEVKTIEKIKSSNLKVVMVACERLVACEGWLVMRGSG